MPNLLSSFNQFVYKNQLIKPGDKILLAVSGGIDSLVLAHLLSQYRNSQKEKQILSAVYVDIPQVSINNTILEKLKHYLNSWNIPLVVIPAEISKQVSFRCYACSKERRKQLCIYSDKNNFSSIALGHNLDDYIETGLMNLIYHGNLNSLKPKDTMFDEKITIIRPMLHFSKKVIKTYAKKTGIRIEKHDCDYENNNSRNNIRELIQNFQQRQIPFSKNLTKAIRKWDNISD